MLEMVANNGLVRTVFLAGLFVFVVLATMGALSVVNRRAAVRSQLQRLKEDAHLARPAHASLREGATESAWSRLARTIEKAGLDLTDTNDERLSAKLRAAGFASPSAPRVFTLSRLAMLIVLPVVYVLLAYSGAQPPSFIKVYLIGAALALVGLYLPNLFVQARADRRHEEIVHGFPDCLDLLLVCVESGLGIEAAMDRVGREMVLSHPLVARLLSVTTLQIGRAHV